MHTCHTAYKSQCMKYNTPDNKARFEQIIKKSRFIAISAHVPNSSTLGEFLNGVSAEFPDARHICYASIIGAPETGKQMHSDDGEPSGTAGKPILHVLQHSGFGDIATAVVRYFGGIKLGAGGLVRAYSGSASGSVSQLSTRVIEQTVSLCLQAEYSFESTLRHLLGEFGVSKLEVHYEHNLQIQCGVPVNLLKPIQNRLTDATRGKISFTVRDPE